MRSAVAFLLSAAMLAAAIPVGAQETTAFSTPEAVTSGDFVTLTLADGRVLTGTAGYVLPNGFFLENPPEPPRFVLFHDFRFKRDRGGAVTGTPVTTPRKKWARQTAVTAGVILFMVMATRGEFPICFFASCRHN